MQTMASNTSGNSGATTAAAQKENAPPIIASSPSTMTRLGVAGTAVADFVAASPSPTYPGLAGVDDLNVHPRDYAASAFRQNGCHDAGKVVEACRGRVEPPTPEMLESYSNDVTSTVRNNDVAGARALLRDGKFRPGVNPCNRFGESLLHAACRRGHFEMVKFLLLEVGVSASNVRDDYDRTPLHDACWTANKTGSAYDVVDLLLKQPYVPDLLLCKDRRGFTPLDYTRAEDRARWLRFLRVRKTSLRPTTADDVAKSSCSDIKTDDLPSYTSAADEESRKRQRRHSNIIKQGAGVRMIIGLK